jgi:hypothetical protein
MNHLARSLSILLAPHPRLARLVAKFFAWFDAK